MSESDQSDSIDDLQDILDEYEAKSKNNKPENFKTEAEYKCEDEHLESLDNAMDDELNNEDGAVEENTEAANDDAKQQKEEPTAVKSKRRKRDKNISKEEAELKRSLAVPMDKVIFGDKAGLIKNLARAVGEEQSESEEESAVDSTGVAVNDTKHAPEEQTEVTSKKPKGKAAKRKPVWTDADDEQIQLGEIKRETKHTGPLDHLRMDKTCKEYLTTRFTRIVAQPKWANLDRKREKADSDDEELLHTVGFLAKPAAGALASQHINFKRLKDLNRATYAEGAITSICFHPTSTAALVCGNTGIATIYSIDGMKNEKLHSIGFRNYPVCCARIAPCGTKAFFGSNKRFYYSYDLLSAKELRRVLPRNVTIMNNFELSPCGRYLAVAGRFGELHLFHAASNELIHSYKQEETVAAMRFTADSNRIISSSKSSEVNIFSLRTQRLEHSFIDEGCLTGSVLDLAPNKRMLATGSREGVVNVYDFEKVLASKTPLPEKTIMNLKTSISAVQFNHTSELLAMSSGEVSSAVKLVHFPSGTVYANFPGFNCELGKINTLQFSPNSGYLALGNRKKEVPLYRLKHFKNY